MHHAAKLDEAGAQTPARYAAHSRGYTRATYVARAMGSVHMGAGISRLAPGGQIDPHLHSFEENFYVLEGELSVLIGPAAYAIGPGHYGLIATGTRHAFRNSGLRPSLSVDVETNVPNDMFTQMRSVISLQHAILFDKKLNGGDHVPTPLTTRDLLEFATIEGARANNLADKTGSLTPGKAADLILLRIDGFKMATI